MTNQHSANLPETAPFSKDVLQQLNQLLPSLTLEQSAWLEGFLARHKMELSGQAQGEAVISEDPGASVSLTILYGTESGNSEGLAHETATKAKGLGFAPTVWDIGDLKPADLKEMENLLVIISTWGDGEPPFSAEAFYEEFMAEGVPSLKGVRFSVCGLGDTSYEAFCQMGKDFDKRLEELGATRIADRVDCDVDFQVPYEKWVEKALTELKLASGLGEAATVTSTSRVAVAPQPSEYTADQPFEAEILQKILLSGRGSAKENLHVEISLANSGIQYEPGDSLGIVTSNQPELVDAVLRAVKLSGDESVKLKDHEFTLREALSDKLEIATLVPPVVSAFANLGNHAKARELLLDENKDQLKEYLWGRDLLDFLTEFPVGKIEAQTLADNLRKLQPRLYSIASSSEAHPGEVHLTVGVVRYDAHGRERGGVCTTHLADRLNPGSKVDVYLSRNKHFKLPSDPSKPIIMVGPGTGIAPFRAFVEERAAIGANGKSWLFFGEQHYLYDFLYQLEWQEYLKKGTLSKLSLAFSRDQPKKVYVQHKMLEASRELYGWLEEGASFYVCGDAMKMAVDVENTLLDIIEKEGGKSSDEAKDYLKQMKSDKRYLKDVY